MRCTVLNFISFVSFVYFREKLLTNPMTIATPVTAAEAVTVGKRVYSNDRATELIDNARNFALSRL